MVKVFQKDMQYQIVTLGVTDAWTNMFFFYLGRYLKKRIKMLPYFQQYLRYIDEAKLLKVFDGKSDKETAKEIAKYLKDKE